ncbi:MAG: DUF1345 domain-containing protein [Myxococcota bacterium]|nr:DUF1345 domain-containing protein [Myxococcota bacterium]
MPRRHRSIDPRRAVARVVISVSFGILAYVAIAPHMASAAATLVAWDATSLVLLALSWAIIGPADARTTRGLAGADDPGRTLVYVIVVLTAAVSLLAATVLVRGARALAPGPKDAILALSLVTVALAWATTHTAFTFRYARLYYRADAEGVGGLMLPGDQPPTYFDFAYFAFTLGMCFQVSDVSVTSRQIRRTALVHAVMSFGYNSVILAFVLSLVFGLAS